MKKSNINNYIEERIKKVSSEFEIDLIRLLKTNSYVSNIGNLTKENSNYIKFKLTEIKDILRQFSIKLYEVERSLNFQTDDIPGQKNIELFDDLRSEITNHQNSINAILAKIENDERDITNKIDTLFKHYSLEIEATQKELDYRLNSLQKEFIEITPSSTVKEVLVEKKQEQIVGDTGLNEDTAVYRKVSNQAIIYVIVIVVLGALILIGIINLKDKELIISKKTLDIKSEKITKVSNLYKNDFKKDSTNSKTVEKIKPVQKPDFLMVKGVGANVREGPGMIYPVIFIVESGQEFVDLNEKKGIWLKIKMNDSREGWISSKLIDARFY